MLGIIGFAVMMVASPARKPDMVPLPGGTFRMGTDEGFPYEGPAHQVTVKPFSIEAREVTVGQFARFVRATGYRTEAEKYGWSGVFDVKAAQWTKVDKATWRHPEGPGTPARTLEPVTQVSWADAAAYCKWAGRRLPTEAEWEFAARGGGDAPYTWGHHLKPGGKPAGNWWQGTFPGHNTVEDGFLRRAPVGSFKPNAYGLYDMAGNVWEWTEDWFSEKGYPAQAQVDPRGPSSGSERVIRGGSWMCSENYCTGYRVAARSHSAPDSGLNNLGFRCAR
jgi:formylglycine-generating enzyme required for sulfatase activity